MKVGLGTARAAGIALVLQHLLCPRSAAGGRGRPEVVAWQGRLEVGAPAVSRVENSLCSSKDVAKIMGKVAAGFGHFGFTRRKETHVFAITMDDTLEEVSPRCLMLVCA